MVKKRLKTLLCLCAALLLGGCAYAMLCAHLGYGVPCLFHSITGLQCPGCGVSRMFLCLLRLGLAVPGSITRLCCVCCQPVWP